MNKLYIVNILILMSVVAPIVAADRAARREKFNVLLSCEPVFTVRESPEINRAGVERLIKKDLEEMERELQSHEHYVTLCQHGVEHFTGEREEVSFFALQLDACSDNSTLFRTRWPHYGPDEKQIESGVVLLAVQLLCRVIDKHAKVLTNNQLGHVFEVTFKLIAKRVPAEVDGEVVQRTEVPVVQIIRSTDNEAIRRPWSTGKRIIGAVTATAVAGAIAAAVYYYWWPKK